jgi:hypothetical protein
MKPLTPLQALVLAVVAFTVLANKALDALGGRRFENESDGA